MVKFAKPDEKPFDPISNKLLSAIANPPQQQEEEPSPAPPEPVADAAEPKREPREEDARASEASTPRNGRRSRCSPNRAASRSDSTAP